MWFSVLLTVKIMHRESFKWIQFIKALKQIFTLWWCHVQNNSIHYLYFWSDYWNIHLNRNISKKKKCITKKKKTGSGLERNYCFSFPDDEQSHWQTNWLCFCSALLYLCRKINLSFLPNIVLVPFKHRKGFKNHKHRKCHIFTKFCSDFYLNYFLCFPIPCMFS